ncbi:HNH endonuclease domain-containing protein [Lyngbya aestuarii]|uniref:HNH endonuclease domain-containing protein n=1 Tax=Lyngbya aestuarii TaxID=118322 RepID=UPI00403DF563
MGKAGQALRQVLESYKISQSALATGLGVERPIVFRWFHERTDPTAQTVSEIVQALHKINPSAAKDFVQAYLGDLTQTLHKASAQELPPSDLVNVSVLSQIFDNTTNSYKYLFFLSLLDIIKRRQFDILSPISFKEITVEMLANAWYPHNYFKLAFGTQDQIANKLNSLNPEITEPILKFRDTDKKLLRKSIQSQNLDDIIAFISRYVPFRLIRPFFAQKTKGLLDAKVNQALIELANHEFEVTKPIYHLDSEYLKDCKSIVLHQDWVEYIAENYPIVRGWVSWEWLQYMQERNPNIPNVANKIFMPQQRGSLSKQTKYWQIILENQEIKCIYSKLQLSKQGISLDHYLPWSFVAHDQLWNLIPTFPEVNSAKSNNIPSNEYFDDFVRLQHLGLNVSYQKLPVSKWYKYVDSYINELKLNNVQDLLDLQKLRSSYEATLKPLVSLATIQGFMPGWFYKLA